MTPSPPSAESTRRRGMDHDRYTWSPLWERPPIAWPGGAQVALLVVPALQWFPLDMPASPLRPVGALEEPYPDYRNYSHRDYGLRVGIFRLMAVLDRLGVRATAVVNAAVAERCPFLIEEIGRRQWEVAAYGRHMGEAHDAALDPPAEAARIDESLGILRRLTGQPVRGWLSPGGTETSSTLDLLAERGVSYVLDWANDDLPYPLRTATGRLHAMPGGHELSDATIVWERRHTAAEFADAVIDQVEALGREAERHGGRVLTVTLHGWISGQPHRIASVERALAHIVGRPGVWSATASEILDVFTGQEPSP